MEQKYLVACTYLFWVVVASEERAHASCSAALALFYGFPLLCPGIDRGGSHSRSVAQSRVGETGYNPCSSHSHFPESIGSH